MKNKFKNQNGVISVFAMLAMLFFLLFILGAYMAVSRSNRTQKESNDEILKIYSTEVNAQDVYNEMISDSNAIKPLYTYDDVNKLGSNSFYAINGKIYDFYLTKDGFNWGELKSNLNIKGITDYRVEGDKEYGYYNNGIIIAKKVDAGNYQYVEGDSLRLSLDGTNNSGKGFSEEISTWSNLVTKYYNNQNFNIYGGGKNPLKEGEVNWTGNGLAFDGVGDYVLCNDVIDSGNSAQTLEVVFKTNSTDNQRLLGSWGNLAGGGLSIAGNKLRGDFILSGNVNRSISSTSNSVKTNKVTYAALTFDGKNISLYQNGKKISKDADNSIDKARSETITYKTPNTVTKTVEGDDNRKIRMGINAYIGKPGDSSANGITLTSVCYQGDDYIVPNFSNQGGKYSNSKVYVKDEEGNESSSTGTYFYQNIADLNGEKQIKFNFALFYTTQNGPTNTSIEFDYEKNLKVGNKNDEDSSFSIIATGTDSVVIKSNIGKVQSWYFNGENKAPRINNGEVEILGTYYYAFDGLEPNTTYEINAEFKVDDSKNASIKPVTGTYADTIFIGNSYNNKFDGVSGGGFNGIIYAVRVYDKALTADQIGHNYKVDKSRFSIID